MKGLTVVLRLQECDYLLKGVAGCGRNAKFIAFDLDFNLELLRLDVFVDLAGSVLVDAVDKGCRLGDGLTSTRLRGAPLDSAHVDAALDKLRANDVSNLTSNEVAGCLDGEGFGLLVEGNARTGVFQIVTLSKLLFSLLIRIVDFLNIYGRNNVEAGFFSHVRAFLLVGAAR